jgi:tetratricopeptide (TPR) repeat protein
MNRVPHADRVLSRVFSKLESAFLFACIFRFCLLATVPAFGESTGGQVGQFLYFGSGARAMAMGGAFTAVSDDASATYWNPAGMSQITRKELTLMQSTLFADTTLDFYSFVKPSKKGGSAWGISMTKLGSAGFEKVDVTVDPNNPNQYSSVTNNGTFAVQEQAISWAYGRKVVDHVSIGTALRQVTRSVDSSSDSSMLADLGVLFDAREGLRRYGITLKNVYAKTGGDTTDTYPLVLRFGASDQYFKKRLLLSLDLEKNVHADMGLHFGGEFGFTKRFKGRFGVQAAQSGGVNETDVGFGYGWKNLSFDYGIGLATLGATSRISITLRFGRSVLERREENVHKMVQKAFEAAQGGNFLIVHEQLQAAQDLDPSDKNVQALIEKFQKVVGTVPSAMGKDETASMTRQGVLAYANSDLKNAVALLRQAYYKDPRNEKLLKLLNKIEQEANMEKTEPPKGPELFSPIDQKVFDARQAILEGKYDVAIKKCQDILDVSPNDITSLKIMGSAFFLLDDHTRARKLWARVLEIDPNDKEIPEFLKQLRPE